MADLNDVVRITNSRRTSKSLPTLLADIANCSEFLNFLSNLVLTSKTQLVCVSFSQVFVFVFVLCSSLDFQFSAISRYCSVAKLNELCMMPSMRPPPYLHPLPPPPPAPFSRIHPASLPFRFTVSFIFLASAIAQQEMQAGCGLPEVSPVDKVQITQNCSRRSGCEMGQKERGGGRGRGRGERERGEVRETGRQTETKRKTDRETYRPDKHIQKQPREIQRHRHRDTQSGQIQTC